MKNYLNLFLSVMFIVMLITISASINKIFEQKYEIARISQNIEVLTSENETWETRSGKQETVIQELNLTIDEFSKMWFQDKKMISDMKIKLKRLESITTSGISTNINIIPSVRDTNIIREGKQDSCKYVKFNDPWISVNGIICNQSPELRIQSSDTIDIVADFIPYKFLFIKFGKKDLRMNIHSRSPHSKIEFSIKKKIVK